MTRKEKMNQRKQYRFVLKELVGREIKICPFLFGKLYGAY